MINVEILRELFDYSQWANTKLFDVLASVRPEEFTQTLGGSYGSIRNTLVHVVSAEAGWTERCGGPKRGPRLSPADFPTLNSVMRIYNKIEVNTRRLLSDLGDEDLGRKVEFSFDPSRQYSMSIGEMLHHSALHGVHHRGQVALLLRVLGYVPGNVDILDYYAKRTRRQRG
jgi:uncharacterized damage-inducible protein DinB